MRRLECRQPILVNEKSYGLRPELMRTVAGLVDSYAPAVFDEGAIINLYYSSYEGHGEACDAMRASVGRVADGMFEFFPNEMKKPCCTSVGGEEFVVLPVSASDDYDVLAGELLHEFSHCRHTPSLLGGDGLSREVNLALAEHTAESRSLDVDPFAAAAAAWSIHRKSLPGTAGLAQRYRKQCMVSSLVIAQNFGAWNAHVTHDYRRKGSLLPVFRRVIGDYDRFNADTLKPEEYAKYRRASEALLSEPLTQGLLERELGPLASGSKGTIWVKG